jgi:hypothetical protein
MSVAWARESAADSGQIRKNTNKKFDRNKLN